MTDLDQLDALAAAATPGPWRQSGGRYGLPAFERVRKGLMWFGIGHHGTLSMDALALVESSTDAAFIAACDPATIRSLVAAARERDELRAALTPFVVYAKWYADRPFIAGDDSAVAGPLVARDWRLLHEAIVQHDKARAALHREDGA